MTDWSSRLHVWVWRVLLIKVHEAVMAPWDGDYTQCHDDLCIMKAGRGYTVPHVKMGLATM